MARSNKKTAQVISNDIVEDVIEQNDEIATKDTVTKRTKVEKIELTVEQEHEYSQLKTKSAKIRFLDSLKHSRGSIAQYLNIRYQHVRNVLTTELKRPVEA